MEIQRHLAPLPEGRGLAAALGFFDGMHNGHRTVIGAAVDCARQQGLAPAVFTFGLPIKNELKGCRIMTDAEKERRIAAMGVEYCLDPPFEEFCDYSPEAFVREMLVGLYHVKAVFCGDNYTFGKFAAGKVSDLQRLCAEYGIAVTVLPMACHEGRLVSSTRIREALAGGDVPGANKMLGAPYRLTFPVEEGKHLGSRLGVPTFNQSFPAGFLMPRYGVYITRAFVDGRWRAGATGVGGRPTVAGEDAHPTCETYLPDYSGDLYGKEIPLEFFRYLMPSRKFDNLDQLRDCILDAAEQSRRFFA